MQDLHQFQEIFEKYLAQNAFRDEPQSLYVPANYILSLGGKRLRPAALLLANFLFDESVEKSLPAAFAIEVFHNFSLVHDDIMDAAPLRRGQFTVHNKFGLNAGILSGDVMLVKAYEALLTCHSPSILAVLKQFTKMAVQVCEGQQMDMDFETNASVTLADYLKMIELKTAVLLGTSLEIGALIGGASIENAQLLYEFGVNLGIAFQLQDDILDAFGDPEKFGKKVGGDIAQRKKTFLYLKAMEVGSEDLKQNLTTWYQENNSSEADKIKAVLAIFEEVGIKAIAEKAKQTYLQQAIAALNSVQAEAKRKKLLENFAYNLMARES